MCGSISINFKVDLDGDANNGKEEEQEGDDGKGDDNGPEGGIGNGIIIDEGEDVPVAILSDLFANIGNDGGYASSTVCVDMEDDDLLETCFTYQIPLTFEGINDLDDHTCYATYGGQDCVCRIEEPFCLYLDCTIPTNDPDAKLDTCQPFQMVTAKDATTLLPKFPSFMQSGGKKKENGNKNDGVINLIPGGDNEGDDGNDDNDSNHNNPIAIDWDIVDWETFDWQNFDWTNVNWDITGWENFLKDLPQFDDADGDATSSIDVCSMVESVIGISQEFGIAGDCTCDGSIETGLNVQCQFENECVTPPAPPKTPVSPSSSGVATTRNGSMGGSDIATSAEDVCGSVTMDFNVKNYEMVSVRVCIDFDKDEYDEYCFTYDIPMTPQTEDADGSNTEWVPSCVATYGGNTCKCEVDHLVCVQVDCSDYLEDAKSDTCQDLRWAIGDLDSDAINEFLPNWEVFLDRSLPDTGEDPDASNTGAGTDANGSIPNASELPVNGVTEEETAGSAAPSTKIGITLSMGIVATLASLAFQ